MFSSLVAALKTPDLRKKIFFGLGIVVLYRIGATIPAPGINYKNVHYCIQAVSAGSSGIYELINMFSGGALLQLAVFAVGITPYITSSIIIQLLTVVIPRFETLRKEGQSGQAKMTQYTRYLTVALALLQATGMVALARNGNLFGDCDKSDQILYKQHQIFTMIVIIIVMTAGAVLMMWLGELITEKGIGNGMSLLIFASVGSRIPAEGRQILNAHGGMALGMVIVAGLIIITIVVFLEQGQRRVPVQYAKRMVGRRLYGGSSTYLPLKVNQAGVVPVIFASSLLYVPNLIQGLLNSNNPNPPWWQKFITRYLADPQNWVYIGIDFALIIFFTYFYVAITFDPTERADEMRKFGGFIPGRRPGKPTADYLSYVLSRITFVGAVYLGVIAILPNVFTHLGGNGVMQNLPLGGTAVLIMVTVALETIKQIESQLLQRNYEGFLK